MNQPTESNGDTIMLHDPQWMKGYEYGLKMGHIGSTKVTKDYADRECTKRVREFADKLIDKARFRLIDNGDPRIVVTATEIDELAALEGKEGE